MKKILLSLFLGIFLTACNANVKSMPINKDIDVLTLFSSNSNASNKVWVGTFQLAFNDMKNNIIKQDIEFIGEKPTSDLIGLNNEEFDCLMLNENSYYASYGKTKPSEAEKIKRNIKRKFNETSDIINIGDWSEGNNKYYAYAMLKKEFEFKHEFDILDKASFNNSDEQFEFFGIKNGSKEVLDENVKVLFYNNENDFAVQLLTKKGDKVFLYRTNDNNSFDKQFEKMKKEAQDYDGATKFTESDTLKIPNIKFKTLKQYDELCNKQIKDTQLMFSHALEAIQFELDHKGGKVKSEALIATTDIVSIEIKPEPRHFNFDKTFTMFLIDIDKQDPYFALRLQDLKDFQQKDVR